MRALGAKKYVMIYEVAITLVIEDKLQEKSNLIKQECLTRKNKRQDKMTLGTQDAIAKYACKYVI